MNKKRKATAAKSANNRIYGLFALILAFTSAFFAAKVYIPLGITLFGLFVVITIAFFTRTTKH